MVVVKKWKLEGI